MKKCRRYIGIAICFGLLFIGITTDTVTAENNTCTGSYISATYMDKINYTKSGNTAYFSGANGLYYKTSQNSSIQYPDANGNFSVTIPEHDQLEIQFFLSADDGKCPANKLIGSNTVFSDASTRNELYDTLCASYRQKWENNETMRNAVPYCFSEMTSYQYDYETVLGWITTAEELYNSSINKQPTITTDEQNVDDVEVGSLTCDYYTDGNSRTFSHVETKENGGGQSCRQTCKEVVTVEFGAPIATQSGMCFQYVVEIKSKVECEYTYTAPLPSRPNVCISNASCETSYGISENGGPSEDFDQCVQECDGGKYGQSCIDQCYIEVYGQEDTKETELPNYSIFTPNNGLLSRMDQVENGQCLTPETVDPNNAAQIQALYEQHQRDPGGSYVGNRWVPSSSGCSSNLGQYYFASLEATRNTVLKVHGLWNNGLGVARYCSNDADGFLRLCSLNGQYYQCDDVCTWTNSCPANSVATETMAQAQYEKDLANYYAQKSACENQQKKCSTETATYTVTVDNEGTTVYEAEQKQNSPVIGGKNPTIVQDTSGWCMGSTNDSRNDGNDYRTVISFPGTYINNKTGQVATNVLDSKKKFYTFIGNEFCTKLTSRPTNTAWYDWKVNQNAPALTDTQKQEINDKTTNNIKTSIDNYGYFGWHFDVNCFYSLIKNPNNENPGDNPDDNEDNNDPNVTSDFIFRTVSLNDLFPASANAINGRDPRFNWSCNATNLSNVNYPIQPVALTKNIESRGETIYNESNSSEYLDYEIVLTPSTMQRIRDDYNAKYDNYSYPKADDEQEVSVAGSQKTAGVTVYRSHFLHQFLGEDVVRKSGLIGCNNQSSATECDNRIYTDNACYNDYISSSVK